MSKVTAAAAEVSTPPGLLCHISEGADPASPARRERGTDNERETEMGRETKDEGEERAGGRDAESETEDEKET